MSVAEQLAAEGKRKNGRWQRGSVSQTSDLSSDRDAWRVAMVSAGLVLDHAPDLSGQVISGELTLNEAAAAGRGRMPKRSWSVRR